jgi:hypothetical protein
MVSALSEDGSPAWYNYLGIGCEAGPKGELAVPQGNQLYFGPGLPQGEVLCDRSDWAGAVSAWESCPLDLVITVVNPCPPIAT